MSGPFRQLPVALAVHCSEAEVFAAFDAFLSGRGFAGPIERISIPGGPWWLAQDAGATEGRVRRWIVGNLTPVQDAVRSLLGERSLGEVVLLGHQGCSWYRRLQPKSSEGDLVRH